MTVVIAALVFAAVFLAVVGVAWPFKQEKGL